MELIVVAGQKLGWIFNLAIHITFLIVFFGFQIGFLKICLDVCADKNPPYSELFKYINQGVKYLFAQLAYWSMVLLGLLLLLIPGFFLGAKYAFFGFDMTEKNSTITDSFRASALLSDKSIGTLAYCLFLLALFNILGAAILGLGLLVTVPVSTLTTTALYQG